MITKCKTQIVRSFSVWVILSVFTAVVGSAPAQNVSRLNSANSLGLIQFTSGGHVLGFAPDKVYLAGLDHALTVSFVDGKSVQPQGRGSHEASAGKAAQLGEVSYKGVWPGVDIVFRGSQGAIAEGTYRLSPGAKANSIHLKYNVPVKVVNDGLRFDFESGYMSKGKPVAWQEINGKRVDVRVRFEQRGKDEVGFILGKYDPSHSLTIDPPPYVWHTFYGSTSADSGYGIAVDGSGNIYITGLSDASWNGPGGVPPLHAFSGGNDIIVLKLSGAGAYQWHTFYGSTTTNITLADYGLGIAVDPSGNVYVTGQSGIPWNGPGNQAPLNALSGSLELDLFVLKLNSAGAYQWHTFYGSTLYDYPRGIAVDNSGGVYVAATSKTTWNGPGNQAPLHAHDGAGWADIVVLKLNNAGTYQWHTFYGSGDVDSAEAIALDGSGNIYVTGESQATWNGPGNQVPLNTFGGGAYDVFVLKLNSAGAYQWHSFYGGPDVDWGYSIVTDGSGNIYVTGQSSASWNGPGATAPLHMFSGGPNEIFVFKLSSAGAYQWHTFYGSADGDIGQGLALDSTGNVYVTGGSFNSWNGPGDVPPLHAHSGNGDIVLLKLNSAGVYQWHTFYGSADADTGDAIAVDVSGNVAVTGESRATWNGPGGVAPLNPFRGGNGDFIVVKFGNQAPTNLALLNSNVAENQPAGATISAFSSTDPDVGDAFTYSLVSGVGSTDNAAFTISGNTLKTTYPFNYHVKQSYSIRVRTTDSGGLSFEKNLTVSVVNIPPIFADVPDNYWAIAWIERLYTERVTGGCLANPLRYCPESRVNRAQMAVFLEKVMRGISYAPPPASGLAFTDVPTSHWAAAWIEQLATDKITTGCGVEIYCPESFVSRAQMAIFLLKAKHGWSYSPPAATGSSFSDVPADYWAAAWIEELAREGITGGCAAGRYCPEDAVTRAQMSVFLVRMFYTP
jgi:beta-propeller repeat-containing protein/S-layer family protein